jgi:L-ascorbate metabolism protein UlaG (beta-lactamase superfamily)
MKIIKDLYSPDIEMLPIDGYFNMGPKEAVYALTLLDVKKVIPMHYGTFPLLKGTPEQLKKEMDSKKLKIEMIEFNINQEKEV